MVKHSITAGLHSQHSYLYYVRKLLKKVYIFAANIFFLSLKKRS